MVPGRHVAQQQHRQHGGEQRRQVGEEAANRRAHVLDADAPAGVGQQRRAEHDKGQADDQRRVLPVHMQIGHHCPFQAGEEDRPEHAKAQLRHQHAFPVAADLDRLTRVEQHPAVHGPAGGGGQHVEVAHHQLQLQQVGQRAARQHEQHAGQRQPGTEQFRQRDRHLVDQPADDHHPQRHAGGHQRDVDRGGGVQRHVLEHVVAANAEQADDGVALPVRPERA